MKLFEVPHDIWSGIRVFLNPADVENILSTGPIIWQRIFRDTTWIDFAMETYQCSLVLIGCSLSSYRPRKSSTSLYLALVADDHSGELRYQSSTFFDALQHGWKYSQDKHEVYLPSGITLNVYDIVNGHETVQLPLEKIFTNSSEGVYTEYCYYRYPAIRKLQQFDIRRWDPDYRTHPHAPLGWWNGLACKGRHIKMGCQLALLDQDIRKVYVILPRHVGGKLWTKNPRSKAVDPGSDILSRHHVITRD